MPTEQGVLSLHANLDIAYIYEKESFALTKATDMSFRMQDCIVASWLISPEELEIPTTEGAQASTKSKDMKEVALVPSD